MKRLLTFCGTRPYKETTYQWGHKQKQTSMLACALDEWLQPDAVHVGITPLVATHENWRQLQEALPEAIGVPIPNGDQPGDEWLLLDRIAAICEPGDQIWIDVTHAFRTLPMVMLVSVFYLQMIRSVEVGGIFYGAFQQESPDRTPVVDLSGIVDLMRWLQAAQSFRDTADTRAFSLLLDGMQQQAWAERAPGKEVPRQLKTFARSLRDTGQAFQANQPLELAKKATDLLGKLDAAESELRAWASPFALLLDQMRDQIKRWQQVDLEALRQLARRYFELDLLIQAASLAREWVVCAVLNMRGETAVAQNESREMATTMLNQLSHLRANTFDETKGGPILEETRWLDAQPLAEHLLKVWNQNDTRNSLTHCGYRSQPIPVERLKRNVEKMIEYLEIIPLRDLKPSDAR